MLAPPDFGRVLSYDRFQRTLRYLARGPDGTEALKESDPWAEIRWMVDGFNTTRRNAFRCGWIVTPDESMIQWTGASGPPIGMPHMSFVPRKPVPLGCELKCVADGTSGVMMYIEVQEGKTRMMRMRFADEYPATVATTLRMIAGMGLGEISLPEGDKLRRVVVGDSWFASRNTACALKEKFGVEFTGCVKTAHAGFPIEAMRWVLQSLNRGESCVFKLEGEEVWAVGWSDVHFKTYITTHGVSSDGLPAQKKRQRLDGRNYQIEIPRPNVIGTYQQHMGWVDRHNRFRQDILGLHQVWKTKRWQTRIQMEIFGMALVDAFLVARKFIPRWTNQDDSESTFFRFLRELLPTIADAHEAIEARQVRTKCNQVLIGKGTVKAGAKMGLEYAKQGRCHYCIKRKTKEDKEGSIRSRRTAYTCSEHPNTYVCKSGLHSCWQEHLADCGDEYVNSDNSEDDLDGVDAVGQDFEI